MIWKRSERIGRHLLAVGTNCAFESKIQVIERSTFLASGEKLMKMIVSIVLLSGGSILFAFGALALSISNSLGSNLYLFDSHECFQIALTLAGLIFMAIGIRTIYANKPNLGA